MPEVTETALSSGIKNSGRPLDSGWVVQRYGKIIVSLAAKLLRIVWALLTYGEKFDIHKAGVPRSVLAAMEKPLKHDAAAESAA